MFPPIPSCRGLRRLVLAGLCVGSLALSACSETDVAPMTVTTSSGYPIKGATVTLRGSNGASLSATDSANSGGVTFAGREITATLGAPPYLVKSSGGAANGVPAGTYYSVASGTAGQVNVTPITHLVTTEALGASAQAAVDTIFASGFDSAKAQQVSSRLGSAKTTVAAVLKKINPAVDVSGYDPLTASFTFGDTIDSHLDYLKLALRASGASIDTVQQKVAEQRDNASTSLDALRPIKRLIVFGDSLSDGGTYTAWASNAAAGRTDLINPDPTKLLDSVQAAWAWGGKFTTNPGPVWVETLGASFDYAIKPAYLMGGGQQSVALAQLGCTSCTNYAQGGARVSKQPGIGNVGTDANPSNNPVPQAGFAGNSAKAPVATNAVLLEVAQADYSIANKFLGASSLPVSQQIDLHLASPYVDANREFLQSDLVIILAGANDVFTQAGLAGVIGPSAAADEVKAAAGALVTQVARLRQAKARQILVIGLPDMGRTPAAVAQGAAAATALTQLSQVFNAVVAQGLKSAKVPYLDPAEFFALLSGSPAQFGITTVVDSTSSTTALASTACGPNPIAQQAAGDSSVSPSSLFCSVPNKVQVNQGLVDNPGTLRVPRAQATYLFADGVHPSSRAHQALAEYVQRALARVVSDSLAQ